MALIHMETGGRIAAGGWSREARGQDALPEALSLARPEPRVRTLRIATGAHFLSFVGEASGGVTVTHALERTPAESVLVVNTEGLSLDSARPVFSALKRSARRFDREGRLIVVSREPAVRRLFEQSGLSGRARIVDSLESAFGLALTNAWLQTEP